MLFDNDRLEDELMPSEPKVKKKVSASRSNVSRKKEREFTDKCKVAAEVSKHANIFDITHTDYANKIVETNAWKKISAAVGIEAKKCVAYWKSLKNSAKYYSNEFKIATKSGASTSEMESNEKYRESWQYEDVMGFYTPPNLRAPASMIHAKKVSFFFIQL